ncbi:MAG: tRNA pseudouridine(55) synthase TruB [Phycisphaerales bacterium]
MLALDPCIIIVDKPVGPSSMHAVARVRRVLSDAVGSRIKVGHAGTLDPLASGVLVLAISSATRSIPIFMQTDKRYHTTIDLSATTTTDDLEGERTEVSVTQPPTLEHISSTIAARFTGKFDQQPPAFSAVKVDGKRAYKAARRGSPLDLPMRTVHVHAMTVLDYNWPLLTLAIHCAKGFYVRALARELGTALVTGGHCTAIRRTAVGPFTLEHAVRLDALNDAATCVQHMIDLDQAIALCSR